MQVDGVVRSMNDIDPNEIIESISILKDASPTAVFGAMRCKWRCFNYD
ncbi:hypothetical protein NXU96_22415 [Phocaeicola vulgatus]|nr:hypothetical protein [Phocaeicola vulgatus]